MINSNKPISQTTRQLALYRARSTPEDQVGVAVLGVLTENCNDVQNVSLQDVKQLLVDAVRVARQQSPASTRQCQTAV